MNQCSQPSWSKLNTAAMLHDVFSVTKTRYVRVALLWHLRVYNHDTIKLREQKV